MVIEGILTNDVTEILQNLVTVVAEAIGSAWGVKDDLKRLQETLEMILAVIADAERKQVGEEAVRLWLRRLKDIAYDADDVMDEFSYGIIRQSQRRDNLKTKVLDFISSTNPLAYRFKLARKIKGINKKLDQISKDMDMLQLKMIHCSTSVSRGEGSERPSRQTTSVASQSQILGREDDKNKLIKILTTFSVPSAAVSKNDHHHLENVPVVSIVGMGGLGKTTLAQLIYNDDSIKKHFEPKIWVCVSNDFDVYRLLSDIMESITQEKFSDVSNFDILVLKVRSQLSGKRYLLVLDDLWNEDAEQWEILQTSLTVGAQGSKILTTTRKKQVADVVKGSNPPYFLEKLQADDCWSIMERKAFSPGGAPKTASMTNIGKEIANKCSGLPLAAKFLGSLLHSKNKESNWLSIRENDMWKTHASQSKIIRILKLSYDNLSPHLQRCFSYCSIFPKDWELSKLTLIQLWMAEGFLQPSNVGNDCSFEDIGDEYFESLLWSSFFDGVKRNELDDVKTFKMHDLVHDLARAVVGDHECSTARATDQLEKMSEVRRLNLTVDAKLSASSNIIGNIKKLRTIIVLEPNYHVNLRRFSSNKHLRILHLGDPGKDFLGIRYSTSKLRRLRYFRVSCLNLRRYLTDNNSFSRLYNLQTLVLSKCLHVQSLVKGMGSLKNLRYLDISFTDIEELPDSVTSLHNLQRLDLNHCKNLNTFPDSFIGLENLKFLDMSFTPIEKVPDSVTSLCNLRTLDVNTCKKLKTLPEYVFGLKMLSIFNIRNCPLLNALPKDFGALSQLRSLDLDGTDIRVLPESCTNLNNLEYVNLFWCELPKEVTNWVKLRKFYYWNTGRPPMGIGELVRLQTLSYRVRERAIHRSECEDGIEELRNLNSLESLYILDLQYLEGPIDALRTNIQGKQNLGMMHLHWDIIEEEGRTSWDQKSCKFQVFEALQPPSGLTHLIIENFMGRDFPSWMCVPFGTLQNLDRLELKYCTGIKQLPAGIMQIPRLRFLDLTEMCLKSLDIGGFPSLIQLQLTRMFRLEELCYSYPSCLQFLTISGCKKLIEIPLIPSLVYLELKKVEHQLVCSVGRSQTSLTQLWLDNIDNLIYFPISILLNNCNLQCLCIRECNLFEGLHVKGEDPKNEKEVTLLSPKFHYGFLRRLYFIDCPVLKFVPDFRGWTSLRKLTIFNCPQVKESLTYDIKSISFLKELYVDFIQRVEQRGDPSVLTDMINLV